VSKVCDVGVIIIEEVGNVEPVVVDDENEIVETITGHCSSAYVGLDEFSEGLEGGVGEH